MALVINDYRFATSNVPGVFRMFATASDCRSSSCYASSRYGSFLVDFSRTSFRLPPSIESLSKRRFWQHGRHEDWIKRRDSSKTSNLLPVNVRVVKNVACLSSLISYSTPGYPPCTAKLFNSSMATNRRVWSAKCGGYCASCKPKGINLEFIG